MNVAVYCRVSTKKDTQNPETQLIQCQRYCKDNNYQIIDTYIDTCTGRNIKRPAFQQMMKDALYHRFDSIIVWKMDRLSRGGIRETYNILDTFKRYNITVISVTESFLNTNNPTSELILAVLSWASQMESKNISERVSAGINRWEKQHNRRWKSKEWDRNLAIKLRQNGMGWRSIEKEMRSRGYSITYQAIRKELLKQGFAKGDNIPGVKQPSEKKQSDDKICE
jgi:DNA invertase Pin-like site-specific DNA recombinase